MALPNHTQQYQGKFFQWKWSNQFGDLPNDQCGQAHDLSNRAQGPAPPLGGACAPIPSFGIPHSRAAP